MSCFLFGVIKQKMSRVCSNTNKSIEFDNGLYKIIKIGAEQNLAVLIGGNVPKYAFDEIEDIPSGLKNKDNVIQFMITRSPMDNTCELFNEWECEAWKDTYKPGYEKVFKELRNFFEQSFSLEEVEAIWARYKCMYACEVYKIQNLNKLEAEIYKQCSSSSTFEVSDFEISLEKGTVNNTPSK